MGIAGRIARAFLDSKLTPLVTVASLAVGLLAIAATPREEEPQISVPMIDVIAALPGAGPDEVENRLTRPIEKRMWEIPGVEYVYALATDGMTLVTVRFRVGEDQVRSVANVVTAVAILREDDLIDREFDSFVRILITYMMEDARTISSSLDLLFLAKAIERVGDHAKNIAELIIYIVKGADIRHASIEEIEAVLK